MCMSYQKFILGGELDGVFTEIIPYRQIQLDLYLLTVPCLSTVATRVFYLSSSPPPPPHLPLFNLKTSKGIKGQAV